MSRLAITCGADVKAEYFNGSARHRDSPVAGGVNVAYIVCWKQKWSGTMRAEIVASCGWGLLEEQMKHFCGFPRATLSTADTHVAEKYLNASTFGLLTSL